MKYFVDANVFLRFFTGDDLVQRTAARRLISDAASGRIELVTGPPVLFEVAWVLRVSYRLPIGAVLDTLEAIVLSPGMTVRDRSLVDNAIRLARQLGGEFADAYIAASAMADGADAVATFNRKDFERLGVKVKHP